MHIMTVEKQRGNKYPVRSEISKARTSVIKHDLRMETENLLDPRTLIKNLSWVPIMTQTLITTIKLKMPYCKDSISGAALKDTTQIPKYSVCVTENKDCPHAFFGITWHPWSVKHLY